MESNVKASEDDGGDALKHPRLTWRMDPVESLADFIIEILVGEKVHATYHVHAVILCVGFKQSSYFASLCHPQSFFQESRARKCSLELHELAAQAFPCFLDYMYDSQNDHLSVTAENAVALCYLGEYLGVIPVLEKSNEFCQKQMTVSNCAIFYPHSKIFRNDELSAAVFEYCSCNIESREADEGLSDFLEVSDVELWLNVLQKYDANASSSKVLSKIIASFCDTHKLDRVDTETFLQLTDAQFLPELAWGAALKFLRLEASIYCGAKKFSEDAPSSLQERSFSAFLGQWNMVDWDLVEKELAEHAPRVLLHVYKQCLGDAQLKRKEADKKIFLNRIVVTGAGVPEANGTYHLSIEVCNGGPVFEMEKEWNGYPARFSIRQMMILNSESDQLHWWIAALPTGGDTQFLYQFLYVLLCDETSNLLRTTGWDRALHGTLPPPSLEFGYGIEHQEE